MNDVTPAVSVIIPTHNRRPMLERALRALATQTFPATAFEVVVVADGCVDDTLGLLAAYQPAYRLVTLSQPASGAAQARNAGAAAASAPLLIFLDDDIEPAAGFVAAHVAAHAVNPGGVVLGPYPPPPLAWPSQFRLFVRGWWTEHFESLAEPGRRLTFRDLLTGNLSLSADLWRQMGGLDPRFARAREDYEFGLRLIQAGVRFFYAPDALGWHYEHETRTLKDAFRRTFEEGRMDVVMGAKHPAIRRNLPLAQRRPRRSRIIDRAIFLLRRRADVLAEAARIALPALDKLGLRLLYAKLYWKLRRYWYARGVSENFQSYRDWKAYFQQTETAPPVQMVSIDLQPGLESAEARLDELRPKAASLWFGSHRLGELACDEGAEPWRGAHLRRALLRELGTPFLKALALEGALVEASSIERERLARCIEHATRPRPRSATFGVWLEQWEQWAKLEPSGPHA